MATLSSSHAPFAPQGVLPLRIYYEDTDFSGSVYHASYLRFLERGRTELIRARGVDQAKMFAESGGFFVVRSMSLDYLKPARMDDEIRVETAVLELGGASLLMAQRILRGDELLLTAQVKVAFVGEGKAKRLPAALAARLKD